VTRDEIVETYAARYAAGEQLFQPSDRFVADDLPGLKKPLRDRGLITVRSPFGKDSIYENSSQ
jgi:hypothetical protein